MSVSDDRAKLIEMFNQARELNEIEMLLTCWKYSPEPGPAQQRMASLNPVAVTTGAVLGALASTGFSLLTGHELQGLAVILYMAAGAFALLCLLRFVSRHIKWLNWSEVVASRVRNFPGPATGARACLEETWGTLKTANEQRSIVTWWINEEMSELMARRDALCDNQDVSRPQVI